MKETDSLTHERLSLLPRILRGALHEFSQSLTAFSFTASNLQLLANETSAQRTTICREMASLSEQMSQAEKRYRDTLAILDWLTLSNPTLKRINLNSFISDVLRFSESTLRKVNCQVHFLPSAESIHVVCSIGIFTFFLLFILFFISDVAEKSQRNQKSASWKLAIATEFHSTMAHISFSFPFCQVSFDSLKKWLVPLGAEMDIQKAGKGTKLLILLPLKSETTDI